MPNGISPSYSRDGFSCWSGERHGVGMFVAISDTPRDQVRVLGSVRLISSDLAHGEITETAVRQAKTLQRKCEILDRLALSPNKLTRLIRPARILLTTSGRVSIIEAYSVCNEFLRILGDKVGLEIFTQPDYDQKRMQSDITGVLDRSDFKTAHSPSAVGTVLCFQTLLSCLGAEMTNTSWGVLGLGQLGSRISRELLARGVARVAVRDVDDKRLTEFRHDPRVSVAEDMDELCREADVVVFCADSGSLTAGVGAKLASAKKIAIVGGPEAGLDHSQDALDITNKALKHFVPSLLCGGIGLIANVEELLTGTCDVAQRYAALVRLCRSVGSEAILQGRLFQEELAARIGYRFAGFGGEASGR